MAMARSREALFLASRLLGSMLAGATAGGCSKMSDEPLARERKPIERVRCSIQADRQDLPRGCHADGRCKLHGGKSTGPRTPEGLERSRRANWKHGHYFREAKAERSRLRAAILALSDLCNSI